MKVHTRPVMSPCDTKNVMSSLRGMDALITAFSHHGVGLRTSPDGLIIALMPVLAHRAIDRRVSIALREA